MSIQSIVTSQFVCDFAKLSQDDQQEVLAQLKNDTLRQSVESLFQSYQLINSDDAHELYSILELQDINYTARSFLEN